MRNAVVEGATYGSRHPFDGAGIVAAVDDRGVPNSAVITSVPDVECGQPQREGTVTGSTRFTFTPMFFASLSAVTSDIDWNFDVGASSTMRCPMWQDRAGLAATARRRSVPTAASPSLDGRPRELS